MTDRSNRAAARAARAYQRAHPGLSLARARAEVAARAGVQDALPEPLGLGGALPAPDEDLPAFVDRIAALLEVGRHEAMERLGLEPGASAAARLARLALGIDERTARRLAAATGMPLQRARELGLSRVPAFAKDALLRGGEGKTVLRFSLPGAFRREPLPAVDMDSQGDASWGPYEHVLVDLPPLAEPLPAVPDDSGKRALPDLPGLPGLLSRLAAEA
ncbi:hypothetical protein [Kitasatospora sp. NPDC088783]|uniref:hypothetical protein n=1 Tax=Kitasatospora sp. NPDC088783 TaxID=3364077 RepID=UPI00382C3F6D